MGENIVTFFREKVKQNWKIAFLSSLVLGLLIHFYKFSNTLLNHDSVYNFYDNQNMIGSGRWFLSITCGISSFFDLPWVNGLLAVIYIAITTVIIVDLFQTERPIPIMLCAGVLVSFPGITENFFFGFTADGYLLAMLLGSLAVWLSKINEKRWYCLILSGVLLCLSCATYQAYISFAFVLAVCYFILNVLNNKYETKEYLKWILKQIIIFVAALGAYYVIWKLCLAVQGATATSYQGISDVGNVGLSILFTGTIKTIKSILMYFLEWDITSNPITLNAILNILWILVFFVAIILAFLKTKVYKRKIHFLMCVLGLLLCIPGICVWNYASETVVYRPMMLVSIVILFIFSIVLYDRWGKASMNNIIIVLLSIIIFNNAIMANISYYYLEKSNKQTYATATEMVTRIHMLNEIDDVTSFALVGNKLDAVALGSKEPSSRIHILSAMIEKDLIFDHVHASKYLQGVIDFNIKAAADNVVKNMEKDNRVQEMGIWPAKDSIKVIDGVVVIKIAEVGVDSNE